MTPFDSTAVIPLALVVGQCLMLLGGLVVLWSGARDRKRHRAEMASLLGRIDAATRSSREVAVDRYDRMMATLIESVPETVRRETGERIFDTESRILTRLAELEPALRQDPLGREKMDRLIESMESLESSVCTLVTDTVLHALQEVRVRIVSDISSSGRSPLS